MAEEPTLDLLLLYAQALARAEASDCVEVRHVVRAADRALAAADEPAGDALPLSAEAKAVLRMAAELARRGPADDQRTGIAPHVRTAAVLQARRGGPARRS
jgi:hypothetical protein